MQDWQKEKSAFKGRVVLVIVGHGAGVRVVVRFAAREVHNLGFNESKHFIREWMRSYSGAGF